MGFVPETLLLGRSLTPAMFADILLFRRVLIARVQPLISRENLCCGLVAGKPDVIVENRRQNSRNLGDRKCLGKLRKSFVGLPDAILSLRILRERVFQHPRLLSSTNHARMAFASVPRLELM
jgi:hypothetical protein